MHKLAALKRVFHSSNVSLRHDKGGVGHSDSLLLLRPPRAAAPLAEPVKAPQQTVRQASKQPLARANEGAADVTKPQVASRVPLPPPRRPRSVYFREKPTLEQFELMKTVGTGSFGRVYMAKVPSRAHLPPVAIKRLTKAAVVKQKQVEHVLSEKSILARVDHPLIVHMHTTFQDSKFLYIVMEYVGGGEFFTFLRKSKRLDNDPSRFYAAHIALIFEYLHSMDIVYRDLKPENLLISLSGYLKLTDFGFAKEIKSRTYTLCGTPEYIAPEVLLSKGHGKPVDWWTLGILIYEMIVGYPPFFDEDALGIYQKILAGRIVFPRFFNRDAKSLVKRLLTHDLARRYGHVEEGVSDVRMHRWFDGFDFESLINGELDPPFRPKSKALDDTSNFGNYDEKPLDDKHRKLEQVEFNENDPFQDW